MLRLHNTNEIPYVAKRIVDELGRTGRHLRGDVGLARRSVTSDRGLSQRELADLALQADCEPAQAFSGVAAGFGVAATAADAARDLGDPD